VSDIRDFLRAIREEHTLNSALRHRETLAACEATLAERAPAGLEALAPVLEAHASGGLYSHQARAIGLLEAETRDAAGREERKNVVLATPTASGKTLVYNLPVLRRALADPAARALYIFPLKALSRDQRQRLDGLAQVRVVDREDVAQSRVAAVDPHLLVEDLEAISEPQIAIEVEVPLKNVGHRDRQAGIAACALDRRLQRPF